MSENGDRWGRETLVRLAGQPNIVLAVSGIVDDAIAEVTADNPYRRALEEIVRLYERANKKDAHTAKKMYEQAVRIP